MDGKQLRRLKPELDLFVERYLPWFGRSENQPHAVEFVHGLLGAAERRNIENIAQAVTGGVVRTLQKFISQGCWNAADVLAELQSHVAEVLGEAGATINVDETGFPKKGVKSVGVKRQYSGTLGRIDNCQVGVMANYCSSGGHTLIDRRLFLPEEWVTDSPRREEAGVPAGVIFRTKPELALEMVHSAVQAGMPFQWGGATACTETRPPLCKGFARSRSGMWWTPPRTPACGSPGRG